MKFVYALIFLSLSGCMVTSPTYNANTTRVFVVDNVTPVYPSVMRPTPKPERKPVPKTLPPREIKVPTGKKCDKFILPEPALEPDRPDLNDPAIGVTVKIEDVIAKYAGELKRYAKSEHDKLVKAHADHLATCVP